MNLNKSIKLKDNVGTPLYQSKFLTYYNNRPRTTRRPILQRKG